MSTKTEVKTEVKATTKTVKAVKQTNLMYLGPTITGVVRHSTVFKDGVLPEKVKDCIKTLPMMEKLFVDVDKISAAIKELNKEQSVLGTIYTQVANKFK